MKIFRMLPPALAPISLRDVANGMGGLFKGDRELERFREEIREFFQIKHCYLFSSGKAALAQTLKALHQLYPGRTEVLVPAFTCYSVPSAIVRAGLDIKLCDVNPESLDFDFDCLQNILGSNKQCESILAIIPTHLFGCPADVSRLRKLTPDPEITILEDAAQVMGSVDKNEFLGCRGDIGIFSLGRGKALSTVEGGVAITDNKQIAAKLDSDFDLLPPYSAAEKLKLLIYALALSVLQHPALFWIPKSLPFLRLGETIYDPHFSIKRMSALQAGMSRNWSKKLHFLHTQRANLVKKWKNLFKRLPGTGNQWKIPSQKYTNEANFIRLPVVFQNENNRKNILNTKTHLKLGVMPSYPDTINNIPQLQQEFQNQDFPNAKQIADRILTLPVHKYVREKDMKDILNLLKTN